MVQEVKKSVEGDFLAEGWSGFLLFFPHTQLVTLEKSKIWVFTFSPCFHQGFQLWWTSWSVLLMRNFVKTPPRGFGPVCLHGAVAIWGYIPSLEWMKDLSWRVWKSIFSFSHQKHVNKDWQYLYRSNSRSLTASGWFLWAVLKNSKEVFSPDGMLSKLPLRVVKDGWVWNFMSYWGLWLWTRKNVMNGQTSDAGMPSVRSNSAAGQIFSIYDVTKTEI